MKSLMICLPFYSLILIFLPRLDKLKKKSTTSESVSEFTRLTPGSRFRIIMSVATIQRRQVWANNNCKGNKYNKVGLGGGKKLKGEKTEISERSKR